MPKQSQRWKALERQAADLMKGQRVLRGMDFSISDVDVKLDDFPTFKVDCKARKAHAHHTFMREIERKYCATPQDVPVLVTKHKGQHGAYVTIPLETFASLLDAVRENRSMLAKINDAIDNPGPPTSLRELYEFLGEQERKPEE